MKKRDYIQIKPPVASERFIKCGECGYSAAASACAEALCCCPRCGAYHRMRPRERIELIADKGTFAEWYGSIGSADPLDFPGYEEKLERARETSGESEAVCCGFAHIHGQPVVLAVMDSGFMMGSMGSAVGERLTQTFDRATREGFPVVVFTASGGARMQEGLISLMQMAKVSCAVRRHADAGLFYLSVITDPTTGGVTASFATEGDVIISEPGALIGFAGRRVIESTVREELPADFQTAEFALEHGLIDGIVAREDLRDVISGLVSLHHHPSQDELYEFMMRARETDTRSGRRTYDFLDRRQAGHLGHRRAKRLGRPSRFVALGIRNVLMRGADVAEQVAETVDARDDNYRPAQVPLQVNESLEQHLDAVAESARESGLDTTAWEKVQLARRTDRPTARRYLDALVDGFLQMHGDRCFADDPAIVAGLGFIDGHPVTVITQEKGEDTAGRIRHRFGCAHPEGYRKALRLARQAEHFGRPVVCLVDTQGAHCDAGAEERGQGNAIADCLVAFAGLKVPVISIILSEGGSGGALALAVADRVAMMENAVYSILTPEGFASILWKDADRAVEAAAAMRPTAADALSLGIIDEIIPEYGAGAHEYPDEAVQAVRRYVVKQLEELAVEPVEALVAARQSRFARMGGSETEGVV